MLASMQLTTSFATSADGYRIAYDSSGTGPALILLHGGGQNRRIWHDHGYVARLRANSTCLLLTFEEMERATTY